MSQVIDLDKELYELTGWRFERLHIDPETDEPVLAKYSMDGKQAGFTKDTIPDYSTDYLLDKLPEGTSVNKINNGYAAWPPQKYATRGISPTFDTPKKALLKLSIDLAKKGLLK